MSIPDTFCIIFIPLLGYFLDHVGYRAIAFTIGSLIMSISHFLFALSHLPPYIILLQIGLSNATLLGIWPCVPILISENRLSTGYGIVTASSNLSFMIVPIIVAYLVVDDPTYTNNELFFACATVVAFVLSTILIFWGWKESLELNAAEISPTKEKGKNSPPVSPKPSTTLAPLNDGLKSEKDNSFGRLDHSTLNFGLFDEKDKQRTSETLRDENGNSLESLMDTYDQSVVFRGSRSKHKFAK